MKQKNIILIALGVVVAGALLFSTGQRPVAEPPLATDAPAPAQTPAAAPAPAASLVPPGTSDTGRIPHFHKTLAEAGVLPAILSADQFSIPIVAKAYRAAARLREVLALQPCYCFCDKLGHGSLVDCFATDHGAG